MIRPEVKEFIEKFFARDDLMKSYCAFSGGFGLTRIKRFNYDFPKVCFCTILISDETSLSLSREEEDYLKPFFQKVDRLCSENTEKARLEELSYCLGLD